MANYSDNFRRDTVQFIKARGMSTQKASELLGVPEHLINLWTSESPSQKSYADEDDDVKVLALLRHMESEINVLKRMDLDDLASEVTTNLLYSVERLRALINQSNRNEDISGESLTVAEEPFYLGDVLEKSAELLAEYARQQGAQLIISPAPKNANFLKSDKGRFTHLIYSLLENAIERSPQRQINFKVSERANNGELVRLAFILTDTGLRYSSESAQNTRELKHIAHRGLRQTLQSFSGLFNATQAEFSWYFDGAEVNVLEVVMTLSMHRADLRPLIQLSTLRVFAVDADRERLSALDTTLSSLGVTPILFDTPKQYFDYLMLHPELNQPRCILLIDAATVYHEVIHKLSGADSEHHVHAIVMGSNSLIDKHPSKVFDSQLSFPVTPPKLLKCLSERIAAKR